LASRSAHPAERANGAQTLRPRMVLDVLDQTVFASLPDTGALAAITMDQLPSAYVIPRIDVGDQGSANSIPGLLEPAADAEPSQMAANQAPDPLAGEPDSNEEGL